jgi:hypothetical protein
MMGVVAAERKNAIRKMIGNSGVRFIKPDNSKNRSIQNLWRGGGLTPLSTHPANSQYHLAVADGSSYSLKSMARGPIRYREMLLTV